MAVRDDDDIVAWHPTCYICTLCTIELPCACCEDWHTLEWGVFRDRREAALKKRAEQTAARKAKASPAGKTPSLGGAAEKSSGSKPSTDKPAESPPTRTKTGPSPDASRHYLDGLSPTGVTGGTDTEEPRKKKKKPADKRARSPTGSTGSSRSRSSATGNQQRSHEPSDSRGGSSSRSLNESSRKRHTSRSESSSPERRTHRSDGDRSPRSRGRPSQHQASPGHSGSARRAGAQVKQGTAPTKDSGPPHRKKTKVTMHDVFSGSEDDQRDINETYHEEPIELDSAGDSVPPVRHQDSPLLTDKSGQKGKKKKPAAPVDSSTGPPRFSAVPHGAGFLSGPSHPVAPPPGYTMPVLSPHGPGGSPALTPADTMEAMMALMREVQAQKDLMNDALREQRDSWRQLAEAKPRDSPRARSESPDSSISGVRAFSKASSPDRRETPPRSGKGKSSSAPPRDRTRVEGAAIPAPTRPPGLADEDWAAVKAARARKLLLHSRPSASTSRDTTFRRPEIPPRRSPKGKGTGKSSSKGPPYTPSTPPRERVTDELSLHPGDGERISDFSEDEDFSEGSFSSNSSEDEGYRRLRSRRSDEDREDDVDDDDEDDDPYYNPGVGWEDSEEEDPLSEEDASTVASPDESASRRAPRSSDPRTGSTHPRRRVPRIQR